ncbi:hypothetical protein Salat_1104300 [Sesamum alatum]|uniref:Uncharacterized protein n=1 Tax=Sesamum alatum TaxID=300844 RepID=A0AAE1YND0_9LAMI|nr:hypothetical protein Salat_1104300 [Sesamum alatum]
MSDKSSAVGIGLSWIGVMCRWKVDTRPILIKPGPDPQNNSEAKEKAGDAGLTHSGLCYFLTRFFGSYGLLPSPFHGPTPTIPDDLPSDALIPSLDPQALRVLDHCSIQTATGPQSQSLVHWANQDPSEAFWVLDQDIWAAFPSVGLEDKARLDDRGNDTRPILIKPGPDPQNNSEAKEKEVWFCGYGWHAWFRCWLGGGGRSILTISCSGKIPDNRLSSEWAVRVSLHRRDSRRSERGPTARRSAATKAARNSTSETDLSRGVQPRSERQGIAGISEILFVACRIES